MSEYISTKRCILPVRSGSQWDYKHIIYVYNRKCGRVFTVEYIKGLLAHMLLHCNSNSANKVNQWKSEYKTYNYGCIKISLKHGKLFGGHL